MHDGEIVADPALVGRLLAAQFPQWAHLPLTPVPSAGTDNSIYRLGDDMLVRLPRVEWSVAQVEKEQRWLPRLAPHLPLAVPSPLGQGVPGEGFPWPWSVYRWLDGETASLDRMVDPCVVAEDLARFITALWRVDATGGPPPGPHNFGRGVPLADRDAATATALAALTDVIDVDAAGAAWTAAVRTPGWHERPLWIHGDLMPGNILLSRGRLTGVIDFGGLGVGDPACDLTVAWNLFRGASRKAFRTALAVDDDTWARGRGWALSVALIQLPYYLTTNPVIAENARGVINEVLADRRD